MKARVELAIQWANDFHAGQVDKAGQPYVLHPLRVAFSIPRPTEDTLITAILHDIVEDTAVLHTMVMREFGLRVADAVDALTHREHESAEDYYERVRNNRIAVVVKEYDIRDNMKRDRLDALEPEVARRLRAKYRNARRLLYGKDS